jgi:hypothetical protein
MAAAAQFEVRKVLRKDPHSPFPLVVFAGLILDGTVRAGMEISLELQQGVSCSCKILGVEHLDDVSVDETLVGLLCEEKDAGEVELYSELCPPGTVVEING